MGWQDRHYNRGGGGAGWGHPLLAILNGSVSIGTWFGIRVRLHASLLIVGALFLIFGARFFGASSSPFDRFAFVFILFGIVLLHEFGHCFAARLVGGQADEILLWPLGGLAMANAPHRPGAQFWTVAGGPLVNVLICIVTGVAMWLLMGGVVSLNPLNPLPFWVLEHGMPGFYLWMVFAVSYYLLLFNLLPIYPLDGGQILQTILWPHMGYYRSMGFASTTGMVGAVLLAVYGLWIPSLLLIFIAINGFMTCYQRRQYLKEMGPDGFQDALEFSAAAEPTPKRKRLSRRFIRKAQRRAAQEQAEQARIDAILDKVSAQGMQSLTWWERRVLRKATERQRQRDLEYSKDYGG